MKLYRDIICDLLLIAALGWIIYHLILIMIHGLVIIGEPNLIVLFVESALIGSAIAVGIWGLIDTIRG
jgi:hypothetical protein